MLPPIGPSTQPVLPAYAEPAAGVPGGEPEAQPLPPPSEGEAQSDGARTGEDGGSGAQSDGALGASLSAAITLRDAATGPDAAAPDAELETDQARTDGASNGAAEAEPDEDSRRAAVLEEAVAGYDAARSALSLAE